MRGFIQIQNLLERAIMTTLNETTQMANKIQKFPVVYLQQFPYPRYKAEE